MELQELSLKIENLRISLNINISAQLIYDFVENINDLGYFDSQAIKKLQINHEALVKEAIEYLKNYLKDNLNDFIAINNLGVLLLNTGAIAESKDHFVTALKLAPNDRNIHENLRIQDILNRKPKSKWHKIPEGMRGGDKTLVCYFDPHGM